MDNKKKTAAQKICFVAPHLGPYIKGLPPEQIGGAEVQQGILARLFSASGYSVSVVCEDKKPLSDESIDGIELYKAYDPGDGLPVLRFLHPKCSGIWRALTRANADLYYVRTANYLTAVVALFCLLKGRRWVYAGAHDTDFQPGKELIALARDRLLFRWGLRRADAVVCQSAVQLRLLKTSYAITGQVIHNLIDKRYVAAAYCKKGPVVWVATIRDWKRPEWFIELARDNPEHEFLMAGGRAGENTVLYDEIEAEATQLDNLDFLGATLPDEADQLIASASLFVNTSAHEGFPNTFLQAWSRGIPVLSTVDPDGLVQAHRLGWIVNDKQELINEAKRIFSREVSLGADAIGGYFNRRHSGVAVYHYHELFSSVGLVSLEMSRER